MDVITTIVRNSSLNGMPKWYQALTLALFSIIATFVFSMYYVLITHGSDIAVRYSF